MSELDKIFQEVDETKELWTLTELPTKIILQVYRDTIVTYYFNKRGEQI